MPLLTPEYTTLSASEESRRRATSLSQALTDLEQKSGRHSRHESLDYDGVYNANFREDAKKWEEGARRRIWGYSGATLGRWLLTVVIGVVTGFLAFFLGASIEHVTLWKIGVVERILNPCAENHEHPDCGPEGAGSPVAPWPAFAAFCGMNAALAMAGAVPTVFLAPEAAGSGIPEVMGYLNGVHVANIMRLRTLIVKLFATFCAVASGLAVGPEGPLVHTGAIIGSGVTRGIKVWRWGRHRICSCRFGPVEMFHNDTDRRDFISMGAAVGFAAAFGAPVGGVLFALEEAASFWNSKLMWRTLAATTCACFVMSVSKATIEDTIFEQTSSCAFNDDRQICVTDEEFYNDTICKSMDSDPANSFQPGLLSFDGAATFVHWWENLAAPIVLGVAGGILGAWFNHMHEKIGKLRKRHFRTSLPTRTRKLRMLMDVLLVSCITSAVMFSLSTWVGQCRYLNLSSGSQNVSPKALHCNVSNDDFRLQWGSTNPAPPPPPKSCANSCFRKKYSVNPGVPVRLRGENVCAGTQQHEGHLCTDESPFLNLANGGCASEADYWPRTEPDDDCCDTRKCSWCPPTSPSGFGYQCGNKEFNDMATALLVSREHVIISIMVEPARYSMVTLACVGSSFFFLMLLTYGSAIPAGVFIPTIMVGACFGGVAGLLMESTNSSFGNSGLDHEAEFLKASPYALIGAVALLGGVQRSSLSLVVIILEGTGAMKQLLPIILTTVVSKWVGDFCNNGLYHTALELKRIPFLESDVRRANRGKTAQDVMTPAGRRGDGVVVFETKETVHSALNKMRDNSHNGFPVVESRDDGRKAFVGLVLRNQIYILIAERHFVGGSPGGVGNETPTVDGLRNSMQEDLLGMYMHNTTADDQRTREKLYAAMVHRQDITGNDIAGHRSKISHLIDAIKNFVEEQGGEVASAELGLNDIMNESPLTVDAHCPLPRVWTLFRTMGLRHLVVLDHDHCVAGIITRQDLLEVAEHPDSSPPRIGTAESRRVTGQFPTSPRPDTVPEAEEWDESLLGSE
eukprot:COSAG02_NODE_806_length_16963_cov_20.149312_4_plen_1025_part_00